MIDVDKRFFSASDKRYERQVADGDVDQKTKGSAEMNQAVKALARVIDANVPDGRNKSIALTELESVQMRANRGIFSEE